MTDRTSDRPLTDNNVIQLPTGAAPKHSLAAALDHARREAAALAWSTGFPHLFLPCLETEIAERARGYWRHQLAVRDASTRLLAETLGNVPLADQSLAA